MTQAVTNFYLFINKRYGNDDFQTIKNAMERTGDDVISYSEVRGFIDENKTQQWGDVFLKNIDVSGVNAIWNELDKTRRGFNSSATLQVSENGSLNATEEQAMENKIALYGRIDDALNKVITSDVIAVLQGLGINENELYYEAANLIAGLGNINNMNENDLLELAKEKVKEAAKNVIKEAQFKNSEYTEQLKTANLGDYDLKNDEDLNSLIDTRLNQLIAGGEDLKTLLQHMNSSVKAIIRGYIGSANIGWYDDPSFQAQLSEQGVLQWPDSNNLNKLQLERLKQTCKDKLKPESFNGFDGFTDVLQAAIDKFIETKEASWANIKSGDFDNTLSALSGIKTEFENSPQFKALGYVINMTKADSEFVTERLNWIGLNEETIKELVKKPQFKQYIKDAYNAIMANPEGYGINNNNDLANETKINQAVMKYIQDNMDKILEETGCVKVGGNRQTKEEQTAAILYWNFYSAKTWQDNGDSHYENDDLYNYALMFVNYVLTAYANNEYVKNALEDTELEMLPLNKEGWSSDEIKDAMDIVMKAIKEHPNKTEKIKIEGDDDDDSDSDDDLDSDVDEIVNKFDAEANSYDYQKLKDFLYTQFPEDIVDNAWKDAERYCKLHYGKFTWGQFKEQLIESLKAFRLISGMSNDPAKWNDGANMGSTTDEQGDYAGYARIRSNISEYGEGWSDFASGLRTSFTGFTNMIKAKAIRDWNVDPEKANDAAKTLVNYCMAVVEAILKAKSNGNNNYDIDSYVETGSYDVEISYEDANGNSMSEETSIVFGASKKEKEINEIKDFSSHLGESDSGIYVGCDRSGDDAYLVFVDLAVMARKFKQFLG